MKFLIPSAALLFVVLLASCQQPVLTSSTSQGSRTLANSDIALAWAPIHYQDVDASGSHGLSGKADFITAINFDGDWVATNNWNNAASYPLKAAGYYSVVETQTHYFLVYAYYHPRDWTDNIFAYYLDEHENDLEGCLLIVAKDGSRNGVLQGMITVFHSNFYSFVPAGSPLQANAETIDGTITLQSYNGSMHPLIAQECRGHGLKAYPYVKINGDGVISFPSLTNSTIPSSLYDLSVQYQLVDILAPGGLWDHRTDTKLFAADLGSFLKSYGAGTAHAPWFWDDDDDQPRPGELATDPANIAAVYFKNFGSFSTSYLKNGYSGIF